MGMFDYVNYSAPCWKCGAIIKRFQSKDAGCHLETVEPNEVSNFYDMCDSCGAWNEYNVIRPTDVTIELNETRSRQLTDGRPKGTSAIRRGI